MITRCFQSSWETDLCPEGWKPFPFSQKRLICNPRTVFKDVQVWVLSMFSLINISLIKRWIYISILALTPTSYKDHQTLRLISSIKSRRKGKERRGKEKTGYLGRDILSYSVCLPFYGPPERRKDKLPFLPQKCLPKYTVNAVRSLYSRLKLWGHQKSKWPNLM